MDTRTEFYIGCSRVAAGCEDCYVVGYGLLIDLVEEGDLGCGGVAGRHDDGPTAEGLFGDGEALAHHRTRVLADRHLLAEEHAREALDSLGLSRVRFDEDELSVRGERVCPLEIQARLSSPVGLDAELGGVEAGCAGRVDDGQIRLG